MKKSVALLALLGSLAPWPADAGCRAALRQRVVVQREVACVQQVQVQKVQKVQQIVQQKQIVQEVQKVVVPVKQVLEVVEPTIAVQYVQYPVLSYSAGYSRESQVESDVAELKRDMSEMKQMLKSLTLPQRQNGDWKDKQELKAPQPK